MRRYRTTPLFLVICTLASGCGPHNSRKPPQGTSYRETSVSLRNPHDGIRLAGSLTLPQGPGPFPAVVLVHGSGPGTRDLDIGGHRPFRVLADYLSRRDVAVLRYDKRGVGQSEGRLEPYDLERITQDALAGVSFLKAHEAINTERIGALGISQGGMIVPMMATRSPDMAFIVVLSGPGVWGKEFFCLSSIAIARASGFGDREFTRIRELYDKMWPLYAKATLSTSETNEAKRLLGDIASFMKPETRRAFSLTDVDAYFAFMRSPRLLESLDHDPATVLSRVRCPVLAINGSKDVQTSSRENLAAIERALHEGGNQACRVIELQGLNHILQRCQTGLPTEYHSNKEAIAPAALAAIGDWILEVTVEGVSPIAEPASSD